MSVRRHKAAIVLLLALYFAAAVWMAFALPAQASPNELLNYEYIQVMRQIGGLPNRGLVDSEVRYTEWHQPPLYFTWAALFGLSVPVPPAEANPPPPIEVPANPHYLGTPRGNLNPVIHVGPGNAPLLYTSRVAAALLGMLGVAALYAAGKRVYGPATGLLMASILAFQPTFLHLSGSVNNDMPLAAVAAMVMSFAVLLVTSDERRVTSDEPRVTRHSSLVTRHFVLGLLCAAAILTKANGVFVLVFPALVVLGYLLGRMKDEGGRMKFILHPSSFIPVFAIAAGLLPLWGGWLWLNTVRMSDTLGLSGSLPVGRVLALSPLDFVHVGPFLPAVWRSYWLDWSAGDVGYGPEWLYGFWLAAVGVMLLGWLKRGGAGEQGSGGAEESASPPLPRSPAPPRFLNAMVLLAFLAISYLYFAVKALTVKEAGWMVPEGRWWLPGLPMLAWLLAAGYRRWWADARRREIACLLAAAVPPLIAFGLLLFHLPALYPRAEKLATCGAGWQPAGGAEEQGGAASPCESIPLLIYDDTLALLNATTGSTSSLVTRHSSLVTTLTWVATRDLTADYTINTQLLAQEPGGWRKLAEHNSYPGQGMNPTRGWLAGDVYRDRLTLAVTEPLNGPTLAAVQVRVTEGGPAPILSGSPITVVPETPLRDLPPTRDGRPVDAPIVASAVVRPAAPLAPPESAMTPAVFADSFELVAAVVAETAGGPTVTLWWRATAAPPADYTIFVHLLDAAGRPLAQADAPPNDGLSPTSVWRAGDVIRDVHRFPAGTALPAGGRVLAGAYRPESGERALVTQGGVVLPEGAVGVEWAVGE